MLVIFILLVLQTFNANITKYKIFGIESYFLFIIALLLYYLYIIIFKREYIKINRNNKFAFVFTIFSSFIFFLSLCKIHPFINNTEIIINKSYIFRQSYYLLFFPLFFIFPQSKHYLNIKLFISKNNIIIITFLLIYAILNGYNNYLCFVIGFIILLNEDKIVKIVESIIFIVSVLLKSTLTTTILIGILFIIIFIINVFETIKKVSYRILHYSFIICIICCFIVPLLNIDLSNILDVNSNWRLLYWRDELIQLIKTYGFGLGYGTSYATLEFAERTAYVPLGAFSANENYSIMQQIFVTGSHNSFISVAFRTGFVGALLFVLFVINLSKEIMNNYSKLSASIIFAFYASIIVIATNVGLESPMYLTIFIFGVDLLLKEIYEKLE